MSDLVKRLNIKAGVMEMGELIAWGSDTALMREAAASIEAKDRRIDELEQAQRWIPVGERLPEEEGGRPVIIVEEAGLVNMVPASYVCEIIEDGNFQDPITHWMPMPEPPK